MINPFY